MQQVAMKKTYSTNKEPIGYFNALAIVPINAITPIEGMVKANDKGKEGLFEDIGINIVYSVMEGYNGKHSI